MNILVVGDSYAAAREADTGKDEGWPKFLGVPAELNLGVSGSTADEWARNKDGRLQHAASIKPGSGIVVISLLGNDALKAWEDKKVTANEVFMGLWGLRVVVSKLKQARTYVLMYPDPYCGKRPEIAMAVPILNGAIRAACLGLDVEFVDLSMLLKPAHFDGKDIHPTRAGHAYLATKLRELFK